MATSDGVRTQHTRPRNPARRRRAVLWSMAAILAAAMLLPLTGYIYEGFRDARAQAVEDTNPRANLWRSVRDGNVGYSAVTGRMTDGTLLNSETSMLIQPGQNWREWRNGFVANYMGWFLFGVVLAILAFFAWRGRVELADGRSGNLVLRWSFWERFLHWYTATLFVILSATGLSILFGRAVLIPLLGARGFATWAGFAKSWHDVVGPFFSIGVVLMIVLWIRHNLPRSEDWAWFTKGGGIVGKAHPSAGRMNAGEKIWFWIIATVGLAVIVSGFILDFPNYGQTRDTMQLANLWHGGLAVLWVAVWLGHAYIGTLGSEGSLDAMTTGYVDANWAKQHHDLWYEEVKNQPQPAAPEPGGVRQPT